MLEKLLAEEVDEMINDAYERGYRDGYARASSWKDQVVYFLYEGRSEENYRLRAMFDDWDSLVDFIREEVCMGVIKLDCGIKPNLDEREGTGVDFLNMVLKDTYVDTYHIATREFDEQTAELEQDHERTYFSYR